MKAWLDIDNPPQSRYLLPLAARLDKAGCDVVLTARSSENTLAILDSEGAAYHAIGASFGKGVFRKLYGVVARRKQLMDFLLERHEDVDLLITGSRSATLVARRLAIPSFVIIDYEHADVMIYRLSGSHVLHPDIIPKSSFEQRGIPEQRLLPFHGLKEDLTFADVDIPSVACWSPRSESEILPRVLVRPPAEESHYYSSRSLDMLRALLRHLAEQSVQVVYSPRYDRQVRYLRDVGGWRQEPMVLQRPVPTVELLKGVDAVVSAGGTMIREAAYLGIPSYSIFGGNVGAVDEYLASIGRMFLLRSPEDLPSLRLRPKASIDPLRSDSRTIDEVIDTILRCVSKGAAYRAAVAGGPSPTSGR